MPKIKLAVSCILVWIITAVILLSGCADVSKKIDMNPPQASAGALNASVAPAASPEASPSPSPSPLPTLSPSPAPGIPTDKNLSEKLTGSQVPAGKQVNKKSFPILYYHAVNDKIEGIEELFVSPAEFEKQMAFLKKNNYTVITFDRIKDIQSIENPVIITFDDGYEDNYTYAYPVLKKYGFQATIFMSSGFIDKSLYLSTAQIKEMSGLINFQGHSIMHPYLTKLTNDEVHKELKESKALIEKITGKSIDVFSYPMGDYDKRIIDITKKYYKYAVINGRGLYAEGDGDYEIKRVYIPRSLDIEGFSKKIKGE